MKPAEPPRNTAAPQAPATASEDVFKGRSSCKWQGFLPAALVGLADPGFTPVLTVLCPAWGWILAAALNRAFAGDGITHTSNSLRGFGLPFLLKTHDF